MPELYSIGHSNRPLDELIDLLTGHGIQLLVDVRRFPGSRRQPHFSRDHLQHVLPEAGLAYAWREALGGRRTGLGERSPNMGLRNAGFRGYADYMQTEAFVEAVAELLDLAEGRRTAMMCSEAVYWRCHRRLISDYLYATRGLTVQHILGPGDPRPHRVTDGAHCTPTGVTYPGIFDDT